MLIPGTRRGAGYVAPYPVRDGQSSKKEFPLAASLCLTACSTKEEEASTPPTDPSVAVANLKNITAAAGSTQLASFVTSPTSASARVTKGKTTALWGVRNRKAATLSQAEDKSKDLIPVTTLPLSKINVRGVVETANKACNGGNFQVSAVMATGHIFTGVRCGESKDNKVILLDGQEVKLTSDRFSADGISTVLDLVKVVAPDGFYNINLADKDHAEVRIAPRTSTTGDRCYHVTMNLPLTLAPGNRSTSPTPCNTTKPEKDYDASLKLVKPTWVNPHKVANTLADLTKKMGADVNSCSAVSIHATQTGATQVVVTCPVNGKDTQDRQLVS